MFFSKKNTAYLAILKFKSKCNFSSSRIQYAKRFDEIPGPLSLPVIGTLYQYLPPLGPYKFDQLHKNGFKKLSRFGPVVKEEIVPGQNIVWLFKPEDIETMFRCEGQYPERRSHLILEKYRLDKPTHYNTGGLLPTNGPEWFRMRTVFQRGLSSPNAAQQFLPFLNQVIDDWFENLEEIINRKTEVDYLPELARLFLELLGSVVFDVRLNSFKKEEYENHSRSSRLIKAAETINGSILKGDNGFGLWKKFETPLYKKFRKSQEYMEQVAVDLLMRKNNSTFCNNNSNQLSSLLETYLKVPELDFKDLIGFACDMLLAGIDTTSYTTSFILYQLGRNPIVQDKLFEECKRLLKTPADHVSVDILKNASYTKAVLKEVLRLHPVSVGIGRILKEDAEFSGYSVPKGTTIVSQNQISCRLEKYFNQPNKFLPERWIKGDKMYKQYHPYLLVPFGHGPRACIARRFAEQNMQSLILRLIRQYKITWNGDYLLDCRSLLINKPHGPILLKIEKRSL